MELTGASALVTGGASGLGLATVKKLAEAGALVTIVDLAQSAGKQVARELGEQVAFMAADVTNGPQVEAAVHETKIRGPLRVVVNCAGIGPPFLTVRKGVPAPLDDFARVININLIGSFNVVRLAAAAMMEADPVSEERGVIINTASVAAFDGQIGQAAYSASKGGVASMTLPLAREFARSLIRVVTIAPGLFETPLLATLSEEARDSLGSQVPHPSRLGKPEEYGDLVMAIVANPMLNGETIRLDGAIRMAPR